MSVRWFDGTLLLCLFAAGACGPKAPGTYGETDETTDSDASESSTASDSGETEGDTEESDPAEPECDDVLPPKELSPADANGKCDVAGEHRACTLESGAEGTQFCDTWMPNINGFGPCLETYECTPGDYFVCSFCDFEFGTLVSGCYVEDGVPQTDPNACSTPLVLRLDDRPVEFVDTAANFSMTPDDRCPATDWPTAATPWLALDRDRNGRIDGGHELFGSGTAVGPTRASDGFVALAALDSDGDARVTPSDARWHELVLWSDHDGDRRSSLWELEPLAARGVTAIDLRHHSAAPRCDARRNCEIERAAVTLADGAVAEVVDVRLACQ